MKNDFLHLLEPNGIQDLDNIQYTINTQAITGKLFSLYFQECEK